MCRHRAQETGETVQKRVRVRGREGGEWCVRDGSCGACCLCTLDKQFDEHKWEAGSWQPAASS
jgi:hypothetical protein